jgi:hypothetical protein
MKPDHHQRSENEKILDARHTTNESDEVGGSDLKVMLARAFLLLVGLGLLFGGVALAIFPPVPYLDWLGVFFVLISPYFFWMALIADKQIVLKCAIEIADRLF